MIIMIVMMVNVVYNIIYISSITHSVSIYTKHNRISSSLFITIYFMYTSIVHISRINIYTNYYHRELLLDLHNDIITSVGSISININRLLHVSSTL